MPIIESKIDTRSDSFKANREGMLALVAEFRALERKIAENSARSKPKFEKRGQLLPRERINLLLDRGAPFLQISSLCGYKMHDDDGDQNISGGGAISGIGYVSGVRCILGATDSGIRGGASTPMGIHKGLRMQEIARQNKLPTVQLVESAGANLFRQAEMFIKGGGTFAGMAELSAMGLPIISVINGSSTAGGAYQTGLSDYVIVVRGRTRVFLAGPPLLKAATGEIATEEELGGAEMHYNITGTGEYMAEDDADGIRIARQVMASLGWNKNLHPSSFIPHPSAASPRYDPDEICGVVPIDYRQPYDAREVIARIVDDSEFLDFKPAYGPHTVNGHARIDGHEVGIIANNGPIDADGSAKTAQFIQLCCQSGTPLVFLQNTTGYLVGKHAEEAGIVKHGSKMIQAVTNATVPKFTLQIGASFGAGNYGMCGRAFNPRFIFAWPNNQISVMGGEQAAKTMAFVAEQSAARKGQQANTAMLEAMQQKVISTYKEEGKALFATARLWDDGLIDPRDSRRVLAYCLSICKEAEERELHPNTFGVARM